MSSPIHGLQRSFSALLLGLLIFFVGSGCGTNSNDFIATAPVGVGSVQFNLDSLAPDGTAQLLVQFYSGENGTGVLLYEATVDYADPLLIDGVPAISKSAVVTFRNGAGQDTRVVVVNISVQEDGLTAVTLDDIRSLEITPDTIALPGGAFPYAFTGEANLNGSVSPVSDAFITSAADSTLVTVVGLTVTTNNAGQFGDTLVTFTLTDGNPDTVDPMDSAVVSVVDETVDSFVVNPSPLTGDNQLFESQRLDITATGTLTGGSELNLPLDGLTFTSPHIVFNQNQIVGVLSTPADQNVVLTYSGPAANPVNPTSNLLVSVRRAQLTSVEVKLGGIAQGEAGFGILPQGVPALLEVVGTFEGGGSRLLSSGHDGANDNDYSVTVDAGLSATEFTGLAAPVNAVITGATPDINYTLTIDYNDDRDGEIGTTELTGLSVATVTTASTPVVTFTNYKDDLKVLPGTARELDVRVNFLNGTAPVVDGFRLPFSVIDAGPVPVTPITPAGTTIIQASTGYPTVTVNAIFGGPFEIGFGTLFTPPTPTDLAFTLTGVTSANPAYFSIDPVGTTPAGLGETAIFNTVVDFGDGERVIRSLDYPPIESGLNFIVPLSVYFDATTGAASFFVKDNTLGDFTIQSMHGTFGTLITAVGTGASNSATIDVTP